MCWLYKSVSLNIATTKAKINRSFYSMLHGFSTPDINGMTILQNTDKNVHLSYINLGFIVVINMLI